MGHRPGAQADGSLMLPASSEHLQEALAEVLAFVLRDEILRRLEQVSS